MDRPFDEVLFWDDGSRDDSAQLLRKLGYRVISGTINRGPGAARNSLLSETDAEWVHFHDIDDRLYPNFLTETLPFLEKDVDALICDADWITEESGTLEMSWKYKNIDLVSSGPSYLIKNPVGGINGIYRRASLLDIGGFDETLRIWEDSDLNLRLSLNNKRIVFVEQVLVEALRHPSSTSANPQKIRSYKCHFLKKYTSPEFGELSGQVRRSANELFHEIVYQRDWVNYAAILSVFTSLGICPPLTRNPFLSLVKRLLGPKRFTLFKLRWLKYFHRIHIQKI